LSKSSSNTRRYQLNESQNCPFIEGFRFLLLLGDSRFGVGLNQRSLDGMTLDGNSWNTNNILDENDSVGTRGERKAIAVKMYVFRISKTQKKWLQESSASKDLLHMVARYSWRIPIPLLVFPCYQLGRILSQFPPI
jgi:hypothetical protein